MIGLNKEQSKIVENVNEIIENHGISKAIKYLNGIKGMSFELQHFIKKLIAFLLKLESLIFAEAVRQRQELEEEEKKELLANLLEELTTAFWIVFLQQISEEISFFDFSQFEEVIENYFEDNSCSMRP